MATYTKIYQHHFSNNKYFLDTCVLLFIFSSLVTTPQHLQVKVAKYSQALNSIINSQGGIFTSIIVLSEYINRSARETYQTFFKSKYPNYKDYRKSQDFIPYAKIIENELENILKTLKVINHKNIKKELIDLIKDYGSGNKDFNDQLIAELCEDNNIHLITDDKDFKFITQNIQVITA